MSKGVNDRVVSTPASRASRSPRQPGARRVTSNLSSSSMATLIHIHFIRPTDGLVSGGFVGAGLSAPTSMLASTSGLNQADSQKVDATAVGIENAHAEAIQFDDLVALGQMPEGVHHQPAEGIELLVGKTGAEV